MASSSTQSSPATRRRRNPAVSWQSNEVHMYCICGRSDPRHINRFLQLPIRLQQTIDARRLAITKKIRFTYCDVKKISSGTEEVDLLIFPSMLQYKGITMSEVESFVEEVVVQENEWRAKRPEKLTGVHIFVCARSIGKESNTTLSDIFRNEVATRGLDQVMVRECTHIYGEKYHGNVVVYTPDVGGEYAEYWWCDYILDEAEIPLLLDHYSKGIPLKGDWSHLHELVQAKEEAQNGGSAMYSFSSFTSWIKENVPWATGLAAVGAMAALIGFSTFGKQSKGGGV